MSAVFFVLFFERGRRNCSIQENEPKRSYFDNYNFASRNEMLLDRYCTTVDSSTFGVWHLQFHLFAGFSLPIRDFFYLFFFVSSLGEVCPT